MADNTQIKVSITNLYANGYIYNFPDSGEMLLLRDKVDFIGDETDRWHTLVAGQHLRMLAWQYYRYDVDNPQKLWWAIADANNILNPFDLSAYVGKDLLIPSYSKIILKFKR